MENQRIANCGDVRTGNDHCIVRKYRYSSTARAVAIGALAPSNDARQGVVMALTVGELAPEISVPSSWGSTFTLSEAVKENVVVLTFYFFAFTGG
jgi:hypothetical protein